MLGIFLLLLINASSIMYSLKAKKVQIIQILCYSGLMEVLAVHLSLACFSRYHLTFCLLINHTTLVILYLLILILGLTSPIFYFLMHLLGWVIVSMMIPISSIMIEIQQKIVLQLSECFLRTNFLNIGLTNFTLQENLMLENIYRTWLFKF